MLLRPALLALFLMSGVMTLPSAYDYDDIYDDYSDENQTEHDSCDPSECKAPGCSCYGKIPPNGLRVTEVPQFVMLTFDDAVNPVNIETYRNIQGSRKNSGNNCNITATYFVTHEYNDYQLVNELYNKGNEIAVHSISHESDTEMWKDATEKRWTNEMQGMKTILKNIARIPESEIVGHRAPFLQTAGDVTLKVLKDNGFLYDSSLPTRTNIDPPLWPYTLDYGYPQDCQIEPCPSEAYPGFWVFPMVQWKRVSSTGYTFHCSMLDACTPQPVSKADTLEYFRSNFNRHYRSNRAPFPVFLHEAWLRNDQGKLSGRFQGLVAFLDEVIKKYDVFVVSVKDALEYMQNPVTLSEYRQKACSAKIRPPAGPCKNVMNCHYPRRERYMKSCVPCPRRYPWIGNPEGN